MNHSMYCAAILVIVFNRIFKCMTKLVALSYKVFHERMAISNSNQYDTFIQTADMKKILIYTEIHKGQNKKKKSPKNRDP